MTTRVTSDAAEFQATVFPFLDKDPVLHTIIMTNVAERAVGTDRAEADPSYFVSVHDGAGEVIGVAMRTPGRGVYLGSLREELAREVADAYADLVPDLAAVAGARAAATNFADRWSELHGTTATESKAARLHKLEQLNPLPAKGAPRLMTAADVQLAADWVVVDFAKELGSDNLRWAERHLRNGTLWFWEFEGRSVSMVGYHLPVFGVSRVGPVYTPAEFRKNGFGSALTAHVSAEILAKGNQVCLFTDLANPTSNKIYAAAGYRPVADFVDITFTA